MKSDLELISEVIAGDDEAFGTILERYISEIYNFVFSFTNDKPTVDDLVQTTFIKAWKNIHRFDKTKNFRTWLYSIAKNTALDHLKKKKAVPFSFFDDPEGNNPLYEIKNDEILPDEILEKAERLNDMDRIMVMLPHIYRLIIIMRYQDDLGLKEISEILDMPYNTVKSRHQRALQKLKEILEDEMRPN